MRCWANISIDNLYYNVEEISKIVDKSKVLAVLKANAYGHGMKKVCELLVKKGVFNFGVATLEEALELRKISRDGTILIMGPLENENMKMASKNNISFTLTDISEIDYIESIKEKMKVVIKIDTGMGRIGFQKGEIHKLINRLKKSDYVEATAVFSHLSSSDDNNDYNKFQQDTFNYISELLMKEVPSIKQRHLLNSFGSLKYDSYNYDFIRTGIILYGGVTEKETKPYKFKPVMSLYSKISYIKTLLDDSFVSYGNTYKAKKNDTIATVSIGYADGVRRELSNKGYVYCKGVKCNIIGRVCMDQLMINIPNELVGVVKKGDIVEIFGENINVSELAEMCGTISYEILCGISQRVPRIYVENGGKL